MILDDPRSIAAEWHGGQDSALYAYASTGTIIPGEVLAEIDRCLSFAKNRQDEVRLLALRDHLSLTLRDTILVQADQLTRTVIGARGTLADHMRIKRAILEAIENA